MAERIEGFAIGLDLETLSIESGLQDLNKKLQLVNSEMKANLSAFEKGDKSLERYGVLLDGLNKRLEVQKTRTESARQTYERMVKEHGEGSKEAEKAAVAYNKEVTSLNNLENTINNVSKEMREARSVSIKFGEQLTKISEKADKLGNVMTATVTPAVMGIGAAAIIASNNFSESVGKIRANLGMTEEEALHLGNVANDVFRLGWGESLAHVTDSLLEVREQLGELSDNDLAFATKQAIALEQALGMDQTETLRGVNALMKAYGMTAQEAFDYVVTGAQNGLNKTDELGDNLAEYAVQFEQNGYSAQDMFSILQKGLDSGAYNLDKVNDLVKEFGIRVGDGTIKTALEDMDSEWQEIYNGWEEAGGTNAELFELMSKHLRTIEDPMKKQMALTEIWGSVGEDSAVQIVEAMGDVEDKYTDVSGAAQSLNDQMEDTQAQRFAAMMNQLMDNLVPVGDILLEMGEKALPILQDAIDLLEETWNGLTTEQQESVVQMGLMLAAGGPALKLFAGLTGGAGDLFKQLHKVTEKIAGKKGVTGALELIPGSASNAGAAATLFTNPWVATGGLILGALAGLGYAIYREATSHERDHQESVDITKGKYEDWFDAVVDGSVQAAEAQKGIQDSTKTTGEIYEEEARRIKLQNQDILQSIEDIWEGTSLELGTDQNGQFYTMTEATTGVLEKLNELGVTNEKVLSDMEEDYKNYSIMFGNNMAEVIHVFGMGTQVTTDYANGVINSNKAVTNELIESLEQQREVALAQIEMERENSTITEEEYGRRKYTINQFWEEQIRNTQESNEVINTIMAEASRDNRSLTYEEVAIIIAEYQKLAEQSGKSMHEVAEVQDFLAQNMSEMVTSVGLDALEQSGIISEQARAQIESLSSTEAKVEALKQDLQDYNSTTVPPKEIVVTSNAEQVARATQIAIDSIKGRRIDIETYHTTFMDGAVGGVYATRATGDDYFTGGLAILGDGGRQEPFLTPSGRFGISPPTDTLFNLEQGTKIWPSIHAFKAEIPHFATGTQGSTEVQRLLANYRVNSTQETRNSISTAPVIEGDTFNLYFTAYGELPLETIERMAKQFSVAIERETQKTKRKRGVVIHGPH